MPETALGYADHIVCSITREAPLIAPPQPAHVLQQNERLGQASLGIHAHDQKPEPLEQLDVCQDPICLADRKIQLEAEAVVRSDNPNGFGPCPGQIFWQLNSDKNLPACNLRKPDLQGLHHLEWGNAAGARVRS